MPFQFQPFGLPGLVLITPKVFEDPRGFFMETYKRSAFNAHGIPDTFVQDNQSRSRQGVLRGLHYQLPPAAQGKLLRVLRGAVFDVAVDIRRGSPTYGQWAGVTLTAAERQMLYVPPGFAHGFCALSDEADFFYKVTAEYAPDRERGIRWDDPALGIDWPVTDPILSSADAALPPLASAEAAFIYKHKEPIS